MSSGSMILLTITLEMRMISLYISRRVVGYVLYNISPSNNFQSLLSLGRFTQIARLLLAALSVNGLTYGVNGSIKWIRVSRADRALRS